jgi:hypothetical protein
MRDANFSSSDGKHFGGFFVSHSSRLHLPIRERKSAQIAGAEK